VLSFERRGGNRRAVVVCNFTPVVRHDYAVGVTQGGAWRERLNTDAGVFGGSNIANAGAIEALDLPMHGRPYALRLTLPPLATLVLEPAGV
jgi:1,4-alpha-glucan branching enzyme